MHDILDKSKLLFYISMQKIVSLHGNVTTMQGFQPSSNNIPK